MAKLSIGLPLTGKAGDFSIYQMKGVSKLIISAKGGPTKEQIANDPSFAGMRTWQKEFGGAGRASGMIRKTTNVLNHLADHKYGGMLTRICTLIQGKDEITEPGKRPIMFSKYGRMLQGLNVNESQGIDSVLTHLPHFSLSRKEHKATVYFTELLPGINLLNPGNHPMYRLLISLGIIQDMVFTDKGYVVINSKIILNRSQAITEWYSCNLPLAAQTFELTLVDNTILDANSSLVLAVGVEFGKMITDTVTAPIKKAGCAKIIGVG